MLVKELNEIVFDVQLTNGKRMRFSSKDAISQHILNAIQSCNNLIAHYESELVKHKEEAAHLINDYAALKGQYK